MLTTTFEITTFSTAQPSYTMKASSRFECVITTLLIVTLRTATELRSQNLIALDEDERRQFVMVMFSLDFGGKPDAPEAQNTMASSPVSMTLVAIPTPVHRPGLVPPADTPLSCAAQT